MEVILIVRFYNASEWGLVAYLIEALFLFSTTCYGLGQTTGYLSNVGEAPFGYAVGYCFQAFQTGTGSGGYRLNSVTLPMGEWIGHASNFVVSVYSDAGSHPGTSLCTLLGSGDPETAGQYVYNASGLTLFPGTIYWIVTTCDQSSVPPPPQPPWFGYCWQFTASPSYASSDGWGIVSAGNSVGEGFLSQFAIVATPLPALQISLTSSNCVRLQFTAQPNTGYSIEYSDSVGSGLWRTLVVLDPFATTHTVSFSDPLAPETQTRFYRVSIN